MHTESVKKFAIHASRLERLEKQEADIIEIVDKMGEESRADSNRKWFVDRCNRTSTENETMTMMNDLQIGKAATFCGLQSSQYNGKLATMLHFAQDNRADMTIASKGDLKRKELKVKWFNHSIVQRIINLNTSRL